MATDGDELERLHSELVEVMRRLGRARRRQFCLQSPLACVVDRMRGLARGHLRG